MSYWKLTEWLIAEMKKVQGEELKKKTATPDILKKMCEAAMEMFINQLDPATMDQTKLGKGYKNTGYTAEQLTRALFDRRDSGLDWEEYNVADAVGGNDNALGVLEKGDLYNFVDGTKLKDIKAYIQSEKGIEMTRQMIIDDWRSKCRGKLPGQEATYTTFGVTMKRKICKGGRRKSRRKRRKSRRKSRRRKSKKRKRTRRRRRRR
tara:strand:- start:411 stop:1028 length:618 start_codon:yes stop_codon:yes gene_type:complete